MCPYDAISVRPTEDPAKGRLRYDYTRCLYCRRCANVCPQNAISYSGSAAADGNAVPLPEEKLTFEYQRCRQCGAYYIPEPMTAKAGRSRPENEAEILTLCPECRSRLAADRWTKLGS